MKMRLIVLCSATLFAGCGKAEKTPGDTVARPSAADIDPAWVVAVGKVEPENGIVSLSAPTGGIVKTVTGNDGDRVLQNEVLLQLDDEPEQDKIREIQMQIRSQRSQVELEKTQLQETRLNLENKSTLLAKTARLLQSGAETAQTYDDLNTQTRVLEVGMERAKAMINLANGRLAELEAQLQTAETEAEKKRFRAPCDGMILDIQPKKGEALEPFAPYADFAPKGNLVVRAEVDELFSTRIAPGQKVTIMYTGSDEVVATGEIGRVSPYLKKKSLFSEKADDQEDRRVREIHIVLKDTGKLIINAKVECKIQTETP